jgi:quinol monooxygenase YgiN
MSAENEPITLIATFQAIPGEDSTVLGLISDYAKVVRGEPGNLRFEVYTDRGDTHAFVIVEQYRNQEAFEAHLAGQDGHTFNTRLAPLVAGGGSTLQFLTRAG